MRPFHLNNAKKRSRSMFWVGTASSIRMWFPHPRLREFGKGVVQDAKILHAVFYWDHFVPSLALTLIAARVSVLQVSVGVSNSLTTTCWLWREAVICRPNFNMHSEPGFSAHLMSFILMRSFHAMTYYYSLCSPCSTCRLQPIC